MPSPCFSFSSCSLSKLTFSHRHCPPAGAISRRSWKLLLPLAQNAAPRAPEPGQRPGECPRYPLAGQAAPLRGLSPGSPGPASSHWKSVQGPPVLSGAGSAASRDQFITRAARFPVEQLAPEPPARRLSNCPGMASSGPSSQFS